jgi:DNA-binding transcriptional ArsR family regulator
MIMDGWCPKSARCSRHPRRLHVMPYVIHRIMPMNDPIGPMLTKESEFDVDLTDLSRRVKALSHPARLAILQYLAAQATCICGEIVDELPLSQATVSQHLKVLREAGLINVTQRGLTSCYCINPQAVSRLRAELDDFFDGFQIAGLDPCC